VSATVLILLLSAADRSTRRITPTGTAHSPAPLEADAE
jgi:hypothetical protein